ncbi:hypothetical protein ONZ45_g16723 [Pleurotus djamor]|nr:hypothetical protein ONZ45_g16723 [Pleurotus djamor]
MINAALDPALECRWRCWLAMWDALDAVVGGEGAYITVRAFPTQGEHHTITNFKYTIVTISTSFDQLSQYIDMWGFLRTVKAFGNLRRRNYPRMYIRQELKMDPSSARQVLELTMKRHREKANGVRYLALVETNHNNHPHSTVRGYGWDGWMCLTVHLSDAYRTDDVYQYGYKSRTMWEKKGEKKIRVFFDKKRFKLIG